MSFPGQLFRSADDVAFCQPMSETEDYLNVSGNWSLIQDLSVRSCLEIFCQQALSVCLSFLSLFVRLVLLLVQNHSLRWTLSSTQGYYYQQNLR